MEYAPPDIPISFFTKSNLTFYDITETKGAGTHNIGFAGSSRERENWHKGLLCLKAEEFTEK